MGRNRGRGDIDSLPDRARAGAQAVGGLSRAFEDLSRSGKLSAQSVGSLVTSLPLLAHPATAAAAGVTALAIALKAYIDRHRELEALAIERAIGQANAEYQKQLAVMQATVGETGAVREKLEQLADVQWRLARMTKADADAAEDYAAIAKEQGLTVQEVYERYTELNAATLKNREELERKRAALERDIQLERAAAASKDMLEKALARITAKYGDVVTASVKAERIAEHGLFSQAFAARTQADVVQQEAKLEKVKEQIQAYEALGQTAPDALHAERDALEGTLFALNQKEAALRRIGDIADAALAQTAAGAFNVYADAMERSISLNELHSETTGRAMQNVLAATMRSIGQRAAVEAAMSLGYALRDTAFGLPTASMHYASAATFAGIAASTGVASAALSVNPGGVSGMSGSRGWTDGMGGGGGKTINITVIAALDHQSRRDLARQIREEVEDGDL